MRVDETGIEATHEELILWIRWHTMNLAKKGVPKDVMALIGQGLLGFFQGGAMYMHREHGIGIICPKCNGNGHSNLFKLDGAPPEPCMNCKGCGVVYPAANGSHDNLTEGESLDPTPDPE